ncbi:hypothetical protein DT065_16120 [Salicibibacter kimchii]|uniref:Uncharacterized protein n=1 Tax=Salicibibacter kimchii TaxID=2099786 RepID=A0A345C2D7_9BACI|nr:hypothetical protein DT065_16120 [Salicibibacter kimchii]
MDILSVILHQKPQKGRIDNRFATDPTVPVAFSNCNLYELLRIFTDGFGIDCVALIKKFVTNIVIQAIFHLF